MWMYDLETLRFLAVNDAAIHMYGYSEEEFLQMKVTDIRSEEEREKFLQEIEVIQNNTELRAVGIWRHLTKDQKVLYVDVVVQTYWYEGKQVRWVMCKDVTEQIHTRQLLDLQKELLEKTARDVSANAIFHELCAQVSSLIPGLFCVILHVADNQEDVSLMAAPDLTDDMRHILIHLSAVSSSFPCLMALKTGEKYRVQNLLQNPLYQDLKPLLEPLYIQSSLSAPVFSATGTIISICCFYSTKDSLGNDFEDNCMDISCSLISLVLEREANKNKLTQFFYDTLEARRLAEEERLRNLEYLQQSEQRFRKLAENSPDIIYVEKLPEGLITYINRKKIFGYSPKQFLSFTTHSNWIVYEEDLSKLSAFKKKVTQLYSSDYQQVELRIYNSRKEVEWVSLRTVAMSRRPDGNIEQLLVTITLITEQKKVQDSLAQEKANLQALIENTTDGVWAIDNNFTLIIQNSSFFDTYRNFFGFDLKIGETILDKMSEDIADTWKILYNKTLAGERLRREIHFHIRGKDHYYEISFNPIRDTKGNIQGASVFSRNITSRKIAENELVKANFELDSFVYCSSHDLRAPLRSILGLVGLIRVEADEAQRQSFLNLVEKSVNRLDAFITDLTNFSRNSRLPLQISPVDFTAMLEECVENLRYMENSDRVKLHTDFHMNDLFYSDSSRLIIIFQNLLSNAVKYQRLNVDDSYVRIHIETTPMYARIAISDNGIGIESEYLPKIFEMFFRASSISYGSGLGLYITKQVVEKLKGTIEATSKPDKGTTFTIILPQLPPQKTNA